MLRFSNRRDDKNSDGSDIRSRTFGNSNTSPEVDEAEERRNCGALECCAPTEIRTPVLALKGLRPGPLDDGGNGQNSIIQGQMGQGVCIILA